MQQPGQFGDELAVVDHHAVGTEQAANAGSPGADRTDIGIGIGPRPQPVDLLLDPGAGDQKLFAEAGFLDIGHGDTIGHGCCIVPIVDTRPILVRDWRQTEAALNAARAAGTAPTLVTPHDAASFYGAGYLAALQERAREEFPDVAFTLIVDCGDAPGHALACLRAGVKVISMEPLNAKIADIARQMGAELVRRPT